MDSQGNRCIEFFTHVLELQKQLQRLKGTLTVTGLLLLSISAISLFVLANQAQSPAVLALAYTSGSSMILLPSTLPAALAIVPLTLGKGYRRGFSMALLFGVGTVTAMAFYGMAMAFGGKILYLDKVTLTMWLLAGIAAYLYGFSELGLVSRKPWALGNKEQIMAFLFGLLLGNAGQSCPNPAFYALLASIAGSGSTVKGFSLGFAHGMGRATLLIGLALLGIVIVAATRAGQVGTKRRIERIVGWEWIAVAVFLIPKPLMGHTWWEESFVHRAWNDAISRLFGETIAESRLVQAWLGGVLAVDPWSFYLPWAFVLILIVIPVIWKHQKERNLNGPAQEPMGFGG